MSKAENGTTLVIVDMQYDFCDPNGALYVPGANSLPRDIAKYIKENEGKISHVAFTLDWHPASHCSFEENGGQWPAHCIAYSKGASIPDELLKSIPSSIQVTYWQKGKDEAKEEYGAFEGLSSLFCLEHYEKDVEVCGLCGDYCVMETLKNLRKWPAINVKAIPSLILSIDNGEKFTKYAKETNLKTI